MSFLSNALLAALGLILLLLVFQFNSISKPLIILLSIFLSFTGVFLGLIAFQMPFVILMTMMGIIALAGIVVNNGVVLLDYTQLLIDRRCVELNLKSGTLRKTRSNSGNNRRWNSSSSSSNLNRNYNSIRTYSACYWFKYRFFLFVF